MRRISPHEEVILLFFISSNSKRGKELKNISGGGLNSFPLHTTLSTVTNPSLDDVARTNPRSCGRPWPEHITINT